MYIQSDDLLQSVGPVLSFFLVWLLTIAIYPTTCPFDIERHSRQHKKPHKTQATSNSTSSLPSIAAMALWHALLPAALLLVAMSATRIAAQGDVPGGGWRAIELTKADVTRLLTALKSEFNYRATVKYRVCMYTFDKIYRQDFAAGTNYQYYGLACRIDNAVGSGLCHYQTEAYPLCAMHDIRIFEQRGTVNAAQVLLLDVLDGKPPKDTNDVIIATESYSGMPIAPPNPESPMSTTVAPTSPPSVSPSSRSGSLKNIEPMVKTSSPASSSNSAVQSPPPTPERASSAASTAAAVTMVTTVSGCLVAHLAH